MSKRKLISGASIALAGGVLTAAAGLASAQTAADIVLGEGIHPESIAATPDGGLLIGSIALNSVYRAAPGATTAEPWITTGLIDGGLVLGVFAAGDTAYVCAGGPFGSNVAFLLTFDLATAAETGRYELPGGGLCNDIAVGSDGTAYVSDTSPVGRLLALAPGASELTVVVADEAIAGIDGIAFIGDELYANDVTTGDLYRIDIAGGTYTTLTLSRPLQGPDGMRTTVDGTALLVTENAGGTLDLLTIEGDAVTVETIQDGFTQATGVAQIGNIAYVVEARFDVLFNPAAPPVGVFSAKAVPLPADAAAAPAAPAAAAAPAAPAAEDPAAVMAALMTDGQRLYVAQCQACHGDQGQGGIGFALVNSPVVSRAGATINQIIQGYPNHGMPEFGSRLNNAQIAAISTYIRNSWGNAYGVVTPAMVGQVRPQ
ncbi:MAG: c-type cytochrome [Bauldia sp.]|nr:c-type cytochrome [Bauldia sp.]